MLKCHEQIFNIIDSQIHRLLDVQWLRGMGGGLLKAGTFLQSEIGRIFVENCSNLPEVYSTIIRRIGRNLIDIYYKIRKKIQFSIKIFTKNFKFSLEPFKIFSLLGQNGLGIDSSFLTFGARWKIFFNC